VKSAHRPGRYLEGLWGPVGVAEKIDEREIDGSKKMAFESGFSENRVLNQIFTCGLNTDVGPEIRGESDT